MVKLRAIAFALAATGLACAQPFGTEPWQPPDYWLEEHYAEIADLRICYLEAGPPADAPGVETILFVHGWSGNVQNWWSQMEHFAADYHVVVFDAPGHGKSERGEQVPYTMARHEAVAIGMLDHLGVERAIVVGNSGGGSVAARLAMDHPDRVSKLVLSDSTGTKVKGKVALALPVIDVRRLQVAKMVTAVHYPGKDPLSVARQAFVHSFAGTVEEEPYLAALAELLPKAYDRIPDDDFGRIDAPTLVIWGDNDPVLPRRAMRLLIERIPDAEGYLVHEGTHTPMMAAPDEFNCAMRAFLESRSPDGCEDYALTRERHDARMAGQPWGPHYPAPAG